STPSTLVIEAVTGRGIVRAVGSIQAGPIVQYLQPDRPHAVTRIAVDRQSGEWTVESELELARQDGTPITARPNFDDDGVGGAPLDDLPRAADGSILTADPYGAFFTGVTRVGDEIWCSDARRPSVYRFDGTGTLIERFVPEGTNAFGVIVGADTLPATYARRYRDLRGSFFGGFHGIAETDTGEVAVLCGAPLDNPPSGFGSNSLESRIVRLLLVDPATGQPSRAFCVVLDARYRRFLDIAWIDGALHAVEDGSCGGGRSLVRFDLAGATDLLALGPDRPAVDAGLETTEPCDLPTAFTVPIVPVQKTVLADLSAAGLTDAFGLSIADEGSGASLAYATNDLHRVELSGGGAGGGVVCSFLLDGSPATTLGLLDVAPRAFDPTGLDGGSELRNYPVSAFRQVTSVVSSRIFSQDPLVYAVDGGLVRDAVGSFDEVAVARERTLDTTVFPKPAALLADDAIGPLRVSAVDGDPNGDGLDEAIRAFGGRSLLTLDEDLDVPYETGHGLTRALLRRRPDLEARLEASASLAGLAPTSAAMLGFDSILAVGCEGAGTVAVFDPRSREAPVLLDLLDLAPAARPVDVEGFDWDVAPGDRRHVVLALDAENGTLDVFTYRPF
ncbi:MAG: esterase-like activity of phytase family protein, partial [Planctomycetota bacterium]